MNNIYNTESVPGNTPTVVNGITIPKRAPYSLKGLIICSDIDCDIEIKLNVDTIAGGSITITNPVLFLDFNASPFGLDSRDVLSVVATHTDGSAHTVKSTLLVEQL